MWDDAVGAEIIASGLDDNIRTSGILLHLSDLQVLVIPLIVPHIALEQEGEDLRKIGEVLYPEDEIDDIRLSEYLVVAVEYSFVMVEQFDHFRRLPLPRRLEVSFPHSGFPHHASGETDDHFRILFPLVMCDRIDPIFSLLPDAAGVHDDHRSDIRVGDPLESGLHEDHIDLLRISLIHLTSEGLDVVVHRA